MLFAVAHVVPIMAASFLVRWKDLAASWPFVLLSIWAATLPALGIALVSTDFPTLIGGMVAVLLVGLLARFRVGLSREPGHKFDLPPLEAAVSHERDATASTGLDGSTHIGQLKRRPQPPSPTLVSVAPDAMLTPSGVGVFRDAARGGSFGERGLGRGATTGPTAVSGLAGEDLEEDLFTTADGLDSVYAPAADVAGPDIPNRPHEVGRWTVYSSENDWAATHGRAVGESREDRGRVCEVSVVGRAREGVSTGGSGPLRAAVAGGEWLTDPRPQHACGSGVEMLEIAEEPAARAVGEGWRRSKQSTTGVSSTMAVSMQNESSSIVTFACGGAWPTSGVSPAPSGGACPTRLWFRRNAS